MSISIIVHGPSSGEDASSCLARGEGSPEIMGMDYICRPNELRGIWSLNLGISAQYPYARSHVPFLSINVILLSDYLVEGEYLHLGAPLYTFILGLVYDFQDHKS